MTWRDVLRSLPEAIKFAPIGARVMGFDGKARRALFDLYWKSAGDYLDRWFETDAVKALFGFDSIVGNLASPYTHGSAYVLLHHWFGEVNGKKGVWGHAIGGMGAITQAMAKAAGEHGVRIDTGAAVKEVIVERGRATGVVLGDGTRINAQAVIANVNPKFLFEQLVPRGAVPGFVTRADAALEGGLRHVPHERRALRAAEFLGPARLPAITSPPASFWRRALATWTRPIATSPRTASARQPIIEILIPSTLDDSLAPPGAHVASLFCQHVAPDLPDDKRDQVADLMIDTVDRYAPGFRASVVGRQVLSPRDLERTFGLPNGDIFHGALSLDQIFSARPIWGHADYRMPLPGLYLCGSGAHPGGGVTGAPGHNAAAAVIADLKR